MSRLTDLIRQAKEKDPTLGRDLDAEIAALSSRRQFGLNFERHQPEAVELPGRPPRKGDKVRALPPRGTTSAGDQRLWKVAGIESMGGTNIAHLHITDDDGTVIESVDRCIDDLVVVAEFRDPIYPGLVSTGKVERGGDKPHHTVINAENFHALQTLQYTHRGKVDAIYIDPPYNTGAKDWKYNNDYVDGEDVYRHSKWLAFMERRLKLSKELLNPDDSVLIVTIDEKEYLRLGMLLDQVFPDAVRQMVTIVINPNGVARGRELARVEEYAFFLFFGSAGPALVSDNLLDEEVVSGEAEVSVRWERLMRGGSNSRRVDRPNLFFPIFVDPKTRQVVEVGEPLPLDHSRDTVADRADLVTVWPVRSNGDEANWRTSPDYLRELLRMGYARVGSYDAKNNRWSMSYLGKAQQRRIDSGEIIISGRRDDGSVVLRQSEKGIGRIPKTVWNRPAHKAGEYGSALTKRFTGGRPFPFPKSLYAVEDALRVAVAGKAEAIVLDFFSGSGTTAHAVMRLNKQDGGRRQSISVTNNEVSIDEHRGLRGQGLRPGDPAWEAMGICDYITKPRIKAAITGLTPEGESIKGDYKFTDPFPMSEGLEENVEFFTLTYESPWRVARGRAFDVVAPLLWMRAGSEGRRIDDVPATGWDVADVYGVIADLDQTGPFLEAVTCAGRVRVVFIVTDDDRAFQSVCAALPERVEPVRLYESYLRNFEIKGRD